MDEGEEMNAVEKKNCSQCIHVNVCHLYEVVSKNNELKRPPNFIRFLLSPVNIGAVCQHHAEVKKEEKDGKE